MTRCLNRKRVRLFHYKTEAMARTLIQRLQRLHPKVTFTARVREDFRFYVWAQYSDGLGGWVERVSRSSMEPKLPTADSAQEQES